MNLPGRIFGLALQTADFSTSTQGHGAMSAEPVDFAITLVGAAIVLLVIVYAAMFFLRPRETGSEHIKRRILRDEA